MIRRFGEAPDPHRRYIRRAGAYAILPIKGRFLTVAQIGEDVEVMLPGGGIDPGESPLQALHREVMEEIGWRIATPRRLGAFRRFVFMPEYDLWAEKLCTIYVARPTMQLCAPTEPNHTAIWAPIHSVADLLGNEGDRRFAAAWARRIS